jgi:predicted transposase/invertase (TIGR01784 family)
MPQRGNVHDLFFKQSFSEPGVAADFVRHHLPAAVAATLDVNSIQLLSGSFVEERLKGRQSDLLFQAGLCDGGMARLYLLFEHKSRRDPMALLQLLSYCLRIWERDLRDDPRIPLRPIIPILIYHGQRPWNVPTDFGGLFSGPEALRAYWPAFHYQLLDLHGRPPAQVTGDVRLRLPLLLLQAIFRPDLPAQLVAIAGLLRQHSDQVLVQTLLLRLLSYAVKASDAVTRVHMEAALLAAEPQEGANIMPTLAQQWMAEGRVEGQVQGTRFGLLTGIEVALDLKFGAAGLALLPEIRAIPDVALLEAVLGAIRDAVSVDELRAVYRVAP